MNFVQMAVSAVAGAVGLNAEERNVNDERMWTGAGGVMSTAGVCVTPDSAEQLDVVQGIRARLSGTISTLPLMVFKRTGKNKEEREPARGHPVYKLLHDRPNSRQTAQEYREDLVHHLTWWRNAYSRIVPGADYAIGELDPIHPRRLVRIERREDGRVYYTFRRLAPAIGNDVYRDDEIWHIRKAPLTDDGLRGKYFWETSSELFGRAIAVENYASRFFANGGSGGGTLEHPGKFQSKEDEKDFLETWREGGTGINQHRDRLLKYGVKYNRFTANNDEAQFIETKREMGVALCRPWTMQPHMVGILDRATFSNIEQQSTDYVVYTIAPWTDCIEQSAERDLILGDDKDDYFVEHNVAGLMKGDFKTRMQGYAWGRQWGWLSVNDIRRLENMSDIGDEGDIYLSPLNMTPAGKPGADDGVQKNDRSDPPLEEPGEPSDTQPAKPKGPQDA